MNKRIVMYIGLLLFALVFIGACVSTNAVYLRPSDERYPRVSPDDVQIYISEAELENLEYIRIAIIEAKGSGEWTSQSGMYKAIRKKAASLGANGVLMSEIDEPGSGAKVAGAFLGTGTERRGNAIAIRVLGKKKVTP